MGSDPKTTLILGIETSCDETAAAVVAEGRVVLSNVVASQAELHAPYGGVFPEVASRQHIRDIVPVIQEALAEAGVDFDDLAAVAVTHGPGLAGSLLVGVNAAKGICLGTGLPLIGVNHMAGHLYSHWLHDGGRLRTPVSRPDWADLRPAEPDLPWSSDPPFPLLLLTVSGGHTELALVRGHGDLTLLGQTLDDAAGEAFDKAARMLGLGYPGGPAIQEAAEGLAVAVAGPVAGPVEARPTPPFPVADTPQPLDFSFSGLKTAMLRRVEAARASGREPDVPALAAGFQAAVIAALVGRTRRALERHPEARAVLLAGGVAANGPLRSALAAAAGRPVLVPPLALCTDNAAMIAAAGHFAWAAGRRDDLDLDVVAGLGW
jgi:N6-L-threonylcarbamoyladenine synthase